MTDITSSPPTARHAWLAALLSLLMPGVGHAYCGKLTRGLGLGVLYGVAIPAGLGLLAYAGPASTISFGFLMIIAALGVVLVATLDSYRLARRTKQDYELKAYNTPGLYILLGLLIQGSSIGYALHVRSSLFEAFRVPAASEYPTIIPDERILVDKTAYRKTAPQRGDTVLFRPPDEYWRTHYVKRIVAVAGDTVELREGQLYVNDEKLLLRAMDTTSLEMPPVEIDGRTLTGEFFEEINGNSKYTVFLATRDSEAVLDYDRLVVPAYHCFVLGDNRNYSLDSRHFGPISYGTIEGRVDYIYWPAGTWRRFGALP